MFSSVILLPLLLTQVAPVNPDAQGEIPGSPAQPDTVLQMKTAVVHGKSHGGLAADEVREITRRHQMSLIDTLVTRLKGVPEGSGSMFDNTMLCYFPDSGETHHAHGTEYPFLILAGRNVKLDLGRRYIRLPFHGEQGHKTLGNWYTTILNAYGNPIEHYGDYDVGLKFDQKGPIERFLV